jgi:hypothetical protein
VGALDTFEEELRLAVLDCRRHHLDPDAIESEGANDDRTPFDYLDKHSRDKETFIVLLQEAAHGSWHEGSPRSILFDQGATTLHCQIFSFLLLLVVARHFRRQPSADIGAQATRRGSTGAPPTCDGCLLAANAEQPR